MKDKFSTETLREFADGEIVFREGDRSFDMYVVQSGEVVVSKGGVELARLRRGDFLGEMSLLESLPRSATAKASSGGAKLLCIQPGGFLVKIRRDPTFAFELMQSLSRRIRCTNERLLEGMEQDGALSAENVVQILRKGAA